MSVIRYNLVEHGENPHLRPKPNATSKGLTTVGSSLPSAVKNRSGLNIIGSLKFSSLCRMALLKRFPSVFRACTADQDLPCITDDHGSFWYMPSVVFVVLSYTVRDSYRKRMSAIREVSTVITYQSVSLDSTAPPP